MFCNKCGFQIPDESAFCPDCGVKLEIFEKNAASDPVCASCGEKLIPGNKFCTKCGGSIVPINDVSQKCETQASTVEAVSVGSILGQSNTKQSIPSGAQKSNGGLAVVSLICGIICLFPILGIPFNILAFIFGKKGQKTSRVRMAKAGIILSIIGASWNILFIGICLIASL